MDSHEPSKSAQAVGQAIAALAGAAAGGPLGAAAGAAIAPALVELVQKSHEELRTVRVGNAASMVGEAADHLGMEPEEMVRAAMANIVTAQHFSDALTTAAATLHEWKIHALAKALANGLVDDGARVDEEALVVQALRDLEVVHVRTLRALSTHWFERFPSGTSPAVVATLSRHGLVESDRVERDRGLMLEMIEYVKSRENARDRSASYALDGLAVPPFHTPFEDKISDEPLRWRTTPFGQLLLAYLGSVDIGRLEGQAET